MKKRLAPLVACLFLLYAQANAQQTSLLSAEDQENLKNYEDTLALLAYAIVNDSLAEHRFGACREFILKFKTALKAEYSFHYPFKRLKSASILYPPDSSFRVITWQLYVDKNEYRYYGAIQMRSKELKLYPLIDRSFELEGDLEQMTFQHAQWYGALYYNIKEVKTSKEPYYLVFGFDGYQFFHKRKVLDVISFKDGVPTFGAPVFVHQEPNRPAYTKNRVLIEYSAEDSAKLNYDEVYEKVMMDHLIAMPGPYGEGLTYYPDGSYEGYELKDGLWYHIPKVFNQVQDEPLLPDPILDSRTKNIFGKN